MSKGEMEVQTIWPKAGRSCRPHQDNESSRHGWCSELKGYYLSEGFIAVRSAVLSVVGPRIQDGGSIRHFVDERNSLVHLRLNMLYYMLL